MNSGVPMLWVSPFEVALSATTLAIPKSSTLTRGGPSSRSVRKRFSGLRSRWTMDARWVLSSARAVWCRMATTSLAGSRPRRLRRLLTSSPRSSSITRKGICVGSSLAAS